MIKYTSGVSKIFSSFTAWKMCECGVFYFSIFFRIRTEYGDQLCKFPYSIRMRKITDQKSSGFGQFSHSVYFMIHTSVKFVACQRSKGHAKNSGLFFSLNIFFNFPTVDLPVAFKYISSRMLMKNEKNCWIF